MKPKLAIFSKFCEDLLPIEIEYLQQNCSLEDAQLLSILEKVYANKNTLKPNYAFDASIDKRKYSYLKTWIQESLEACDVDHALKTIQDFEWKVQSDSITQEEEKSLVKMMSGYDNSHYQFLRFYGLMLHFRQYLQIRLRGKLMPQVNEWLEKYADNYAECSMVFQSLHQLTSDIIDEYGLLTITDKITEQKLLQIAEREDLDGLNRYAAAVRLWFYYMNKGAYAKMKTLLQKVETLMVKHRYLGRRLAVNYYANSLLLHSKTEELDKARFYGYLSLRYHTNDYLFYVINLSSVLLRMGEAHEAMLHMKAAFPAMRSTADNHNKIGFVAHYVHCLIDLGKLKEAGRFAENYLGSHLKEVMSTRWHLFFAAYFRSLVLLEKFPRLLYVVNRYKLREKETQYSKKAHYLPTMSWYIALAEFMEGSISEKVAIEKMKSSALILMNDPLRTNRIHQQLNQLYHQQPQLIKKLKSELNLNN